MSGHIIRWNIQDHNGCLHVCKGEHDKNQACEFEPLTLEDIGLFRRRIVELQEQNRQLEERIASLKTVEA